MKLFAISDQHYGHQNIIKYCNRTLSEEECKKLGLSENFVASENLSALDDAKMMIIAHNSVVKPEDVVIFVGDVQASKQGRDWISKIIPKLNGQKILVRGNHDHQTDTEFLKLGFCRVCTDVRIGKFCFHHYPDTVAIIEKCKKEGLKLVCGHTHKPFKDYKDGVERINVCVDVMGREPMFLGNLTDILEESKNDGI